MIIDRKYAVIKYFVIGFILLIIIIASINILMRIKLHLHLMNKLIMFIFTVC